MIEETTKDNMIRLIVGKTSKLIGDINLTHTKEEEAMKKIQIEGYINNFLDSNEIVLLRINVGKREIASSTTTVGKTTRTGDYISWTLRANAKSVIKIDNVLNFK